MLKTGTRTARPRMQPLKLSASGAFRMGFAQLFAEAVLSLEKEQMKVRALHVRLCCPGGTLAESSRESFLLSLMEKCSLNHRRQSVVPPRQTVYRMDRLGPSEETILGSMRRCLLLESGRKGSCRDVALRDECIGSDIWDRSDPKILPVFHRKVALWA